MPRPAGSRNRDYAASRSALVTALAAHLLDEVGEPTPLSGLAQAAGVTTPTLRHYFGDRDGVFRAVLEAVHADSAGHLAAMADPGDADPAELLPDVLASLVEVWRRYGFGRVVASGLSLGLGNPARGPVVVEEVLEPLLQAVERLLGRLVADGRLPPVDVRAGALSLLGSLVVALLHQDGLDGARCRPLDVPAFARRHARTVLDGLRAGHDPRGAGTMER